MDDESSMMFFSVNGYLFALEIGNLLEIAQIDAAKISTEEGSFKYSFDFRGKSIPVIDMAALAGTTPVSMAGPLQLLVVEVNSCPLAFLIDKVLEFAKLKGIVYRFPTMLQTAKNRYIKGICRFDNRVSFILDPALAMTGHEVA